MSDNVVKRLLKKENQVVDSCNMSFFLMIMEFVDLIVIERVSF